MLCGGKTICSRRGSKAEFLEEGHLSWVGKGRAGAGNKGKSPVYKAVYEEMSLAAG